jgi:hypothetical protein
MVPKGTVRGYSTDAVRRFGLCPVRDSFSACRNCIERANRQFRHLYSQVVFPTEWSKQDRPRSRRGLWFHSA